MASNTPKENPIWPKIDPDKVIGYWKEAYKAEQEECERLMLGMRLGGKTELCAAKWKDLTGEWEGEEPIYDVKTMWEDQDDRQKDS